MKKILTCFLILVFVFEYCFLNCSAFAADKDSKNYKSNFEKYNLSEEQMASVSKLTKAYRYDIEVTEDLIQKGLLDDFMKVKTQYGQTYVMMEIFMYINGKTDDFSKERMEQLKRIGRHYAIGVNDKFYKGLSKIKPGKIPPGSNIYISRDDTYNVKTLKRRYEFEQNYDLTKEEKNWLERDTYYYKKNIKFAKEVIEDGYYDDYCRYCHIIGVYNNDEPFKRQYKIMRRLLNSGSFTEQEIRQIAYTGRDKDIIQLDDEYYANIDKVSENTLKNAKYHDYYNKSYYKNVRKLKQYKEFQKENNLDDKEMEKIWEDTNKLSKNVKLVKNAMQDGTYEDYYNYRTSSDIHFKDNYKTYLLVKQNDTLTDEEKKYIINQYGKPCVSLNPTYWGNKPKKVRNTLNSKRIEDANKYNVIKERISYRRPYAIEWVSDITTRLLIGGLILSGIGFVGGMMIWAAFSDSGGEFIKLKF